MTKLKAAALGRAGVAAAGLLVLPLLGAQAATAAGGVVASSPGATAGAPCLVSDRADAVHRPRDHSRVTPDAAGRVQRELAAARERATADRLRATDRVLVPVHVHVIHSEDPAVPRMTTQDVRESLRRLNQDFRGAETNGRQSTGFRFQLKSISRTVHTKQYYAEPMSRWDKLSKRSHHLGGRDTLNLYFADPGGSPSHGGQTTGLLGWSRFPWEQRRTPLLDGVTVNVGSVPGGSSTGYTEGDTLTHEVGHWLGLYHVFQGGCRDLDHVADTPAQAFPIADCAGRYDTCPGKAGADPVRNYMGYAYDRCMTHFSRGQVARMETAWLKYRAPLRRR